MLKTRDMYKALINTQLILLKEVYLSFIDRVLKSTKKSLVKIFWEFIKSMKKLQINKWKGNRFHVSKNENLLAIIRQKIDNNYDDLLSAAVNSSCRNIYENIVLGEGGTLCRQYLTLLL